MSAPLVAACVYVVGVALSVVPLARWAWSQWRNEFPLSGTRREAMLFACGLALFWPACLIAAVASRGLTALTRHALGEESE